MPIALGLASMAAIRLGQPRRVRRLPAQARSASSARWFFAGGVGVTTALVGFAVTLPADVAVAASIGTLSLGGLAVTLAGPGATRGLQVLAASGLVSWLVEVGLLIGRVPR